MPQFRRATVNEVIEERAGLQRVDTTEGRAYVLTDLIGDVHAGDEVILNTTAVSLGLGTGGWHVVHWNLARNGFDRAGAGHIMKMRYTSLQVDTGAAEEGHADLPQTLDGAPIVVCTLHSQVGVVAAVLRHLRSKAVIAYVMTDGAALPIALSDLVASMTANGTIDATITAGHAFGGDYESVSIPSALTVARHVARADAIIVGMGPGVVGTGSALGTTAVEAAAILDAAASLGGQPILCVRASEADPRERHRGISHHVDTVLRLVHTRVDVPLSERASHVDVGAVLAGAGLQVTTMGRGPAEDPLSFATAAAAAVAAAERL